MKKIVLSSIILAGSFLMNSCSDSFFDINDDPNNPKDATLALTLPSPLSRTAFVAGGYYQSLGGFWSQHYAQSPAATQWIAYETYNLTEDDFDRQFALLYAGTLTDCKKLIDQSEASGDWGYYLIGTVVQAYTYQMLADLYDQIPYFEALQGEANLQPKYDKGEDVYVDLLKRIDDALSKDLTVKTVTNPGSQDLIFGGDFSKWISFAKTLKLKMYLRFVNVDAQKYSSEIKALLAENDLLKEDAAFKAFKNEVNGYNPFYALHYYKLTGNVIASNTTVNFLKELGDPRLAKIYNPSVTGSLLNGIDQGAYKTTAGSYRNFAQPNISATYPVYFFSKEEVLFLEAEAEARYGTDAKAEVAYEAGVAASLASWGVNGFTYPYNGIQSIMEQKWVAAINKRSLESFFDYNRTGYPDFFVRSASSVLPGEEKPKRLFFPDSEQKSNPNTPDKVALTVKVWWGK